MDKKILKKIVITATETIFQAMEKINENYKEIVFVVNGANQLIGSITDGDIRRGFLKGLSLDSEVQLIMNRDFTFVDNSFDRAAVLDIMKSRSIRQIPVVNDKKEMIGIHFLDELIGTSIKSNIAVIMAGGKGVRLRPLTENCPKPMLPVAGRPILERVILHLISYGIRKIYLSVNYLGHMIEDYFGDGRKFGCSIEYLKENTPLGTGGALSLLPVVPKDPIIVMNGDVISQVNIEQMLKFHLYNQHIITIGASNYQVDIPFGVLKTEKSQLIAIEEKPKQNFLISSGIYVINPDAIKIIPKNQDYPITELFEKCLEEKKPIGVYSIDDDWIDVGRHDDLNKARGIS